MNSQQCRQSAASTPASAIDSTCEDRAGAVSGNHGSSPSGNQSTREYTDEHALDKQEEIRSHYAQVATQIAADARVPSRIPSLAFDHACESCDAPDVADERATAALRGEAAQLYGREALAGVPTAALASSRGCGDPVAQAHLQPGETVLDLGSGGGIDAIIAARLVDEGGQVYGLDMTTEMVELARQNAREAGCANLEFVHGSAERIPLPENSLDVVISNCVINLVQDKKAVFAEMKRVLKPGGRMVVSDIVAWSAIPPEAQKDLQAITGCRSGIPLAADYEAMLQETGFAERHLEPKTTYTWDVLAEKAERKGRMEHLTALEAAGLNSAVDGACGSAIVTARA